LTDYDVSCTNVEVDFNFAGLSRSVVIKPENDWLDVGLPQIAVYRKCHVFQLIVLTISPCCVKVKINVDLYSTLS